MNSTLRNNLRWLDRHFNRHSARRVPRAPKLSSRRHDPSRFALESLEPRVLLSADGLVTGLTGALQNGLLTTGDSFVGIIATEVLFDTPIPGVLQTTHDVNGVTADDAPNGTLDDKDVHVPNVRDVLSINVDQNLNDTIPGIPGFSSLADRYDYLDDLQDDLFEFQKLEKTLAAMDRNSGSTVDDIVDFHEIYDVLVAGAISDFLTDGSFLDIPTLEAAFASFLSGLDEPSSLNSLIDLDLLGVSNNSDADHFAFSFTVELIVKDDYFIDLGLEADRNEILLPEKTFSPGTPDDPNTGANELVSPSVSNTPLSPRTVQLRGKLTLPVSFSFDITPPAVANSDYRFSVPGDITVAVDDSVLTGDNGETLQGLITNVGFLGTVVPGPAGDSKINLHMDWTIKVTDPSSPIHLGFTQVLPTTSGSGILTGATALPNDPGTAFVFPQDVFFNLTVGTQLTSPAPEVRVTAGSTTGNTTATNLKNDVQTALNTAGLGSIVTAGLDGFDKLTLTLPATNITPLGFASNELFSPGGTLSAPVAPSILGNTSADVIKFLLSVGAAIPTLVTVTTTPGDDDPDGVPANGDEGQLSIAGLIADINTALAAAGLPGVSAVNNAGKVRLTSGSSLEVTRTLKLNADGEITLTELAHASFPEFRVAAQDTSDDKFQLTMPLDVRDGVDFGPTPNNPGIKIDVQPFVFSAADLKLDIAGIAKRLTLPLTDLDGVAIDAAGSDFLQFLDFNVVGAAEATGMIQQLETWLLKFKDTDMLGKFNIPFVQSVLGDVLGFEDLLHDTLLMDDLDDDADGNNIGKLLSKVTGLDPDNPNTIFASFSTAQEFGARLDKLFNPSILTLVPVSVNDDGENDTDFAAYDRTNRHLTYRISLTHLIGTNNIAADYTSNVDLSPVGEISTQSKVHLEAIGHFDAILGIEMGPGQIKSDTVLTTLNGGIGAGIVEPGIAFTGAADALIVRGRLSADATFDVSVTNGSGTTLARVTVTKASTAENTELAHLLTDIDTALANAKLLPIPMLPTLPTPVNISDRLEAASELGRIVLRAKTGAGVVRYSITASTGDTSYTELGLASTAAVSVFLDVEPAAVKVSADVTLNFEINNNGTIIPIILDSGTTGVAATGGNNTITDLANDINEALAGTSLNGKIVAARNGNKLVLVGIDGSVKSFRVVSGGGPAGEIGFSSAKIAGTFLVVPNDTNAVDRTNVFGKLTTDAHFSIKLNGGVFVPASVSVVSTNDNASVADLIANINQAINTATPDAGVTFPLNGKIEAFQAGNLRIGFRAVDDDVLSFQVQAVGGDSAVTQMGLLAGTQTADAPLRVTAIKEAPYFYGPRTNATFTVNVSGSAVAASNGPKVVTLLTNETLTNPTIQDLVGDVRRALDTAYGGVSNNPLLVSNDGDRILLKPKSTGAGVGVTGFTVTAVAGNSALTDLKLFQAGPTPTVADTADLLIYTRNGTVFRVTLDGDTTVGDVVSDINGIVGVDAVINELATGLKLNDTTGPGSVLFRVDSVNGSHAAQALGIFGADTDVNHPTVDHQIDGTRIATLQLADRFFIRQVDSSTNILRADVTVGAAKFDGSSSQIVDVGNANTIKIPAHGFVPGDAVVYHNGGGTSLGGLTSGNTYYIITVDNNTVKLASSKQNALDGSALGISVGAGSAHRLQSVLSLEASFGFVGVKLTGSGALTGSFGAGLTDEYNDADDEVRLSDLLKALSKTTDADADVDVFDLAKYVGFPSLTLTGDLVFGVELLPGADIIDLSGLTPTVTFHLNGPGSPFQLKPGASAPFDVSDLVSSNINDPDFADTLPDVDVSYTDLGSLANFTDIDFENILTALEGLSDFLGQFSAFDFLNEEIPLIGVSFNDLVDIAQKFQTAVTEIVKNPAGSVQLVEQKIKETFGLPPESNVFDLSLVDNGDGDGSNADMLKVKINLSKAFSKALQVDLDLSDQLPGISIMGSAGLSASGFLTALLTFGVDLDSPTDLYLFTHSSQTGITAGLTAEADNLTFNAALGPLGIFITGGDVEVHLTGGLNTTGGNATDKVPIGDVLADLEGTGFTPTFEGEVEATLPIFFPTQSIYKGDIEFEAEFELTPDFELEFESDLEVPPDILNVDFSQFSLFDSMILAVDTFDAFLAGVQDFLDGEIFGIKLPLIGDKLSEGAEFIADMRKDVIQPFREFIETAQTQGTTIVQTFLFDLLGPGNLDVGGSLSGFGLLLDPTDLDLAGNPTPATSSDRGHINAIVKKSENLTGPISTNFAQWNFLIGQVYTPPLDFDFDLGFPGLNLDLDGNLIFSLGWKLGLGLGISIKDGPYIEVTRSNSTDDPASHLVANVPGAGTNVTFENISPNKSDLDTNGNANGSAAGRINGLAVDPSNNQTFYAASEYGGIYKTTDGGLTWALLSNHNPMVTWDVEASSSTQVYATSFYDGRINSLAGINVSTDGGGTWTHPASAVPNNSGGGSDNTPQEGYSVEALRVAEPAAYGISIQKGTPANVAIGTNAGLAISHNSGSTWQFVNPFTTSVFFDTGLFNLENPADTAILDAFIPIIQKYLADNPSFNVEVAGYTDTIGTTASNQTLSDNRADAVRDYLVAQGIATGRITIVGFGEQAAHLAVNTGDAENDGAPGTSEQANRRAEIHLQAVEIYDVVYQAGGIIDVAGALGHARSTDDGAHWSLFSQPSAAQGAISIAASPDEDYVLFMAGTNNRLYESDDAGATWLLVGADFNPQGRIPFVTVNDRSGNGGRDFDVWFGDTNLLRFTATTPVVEAPGGARRLALTSFATDGVDNDADTNIDEGDERFIQNAGNVGRPAQSNTGAHADVADVVFDSSLAVDALPKLHSNDGGVYRNTANSQLPSWEQPNITPHGIFIMGFVGVDQPGNDDEDLYFVLQDNGAWALMKAGAADVPGLTPANGGWHNAASADAFDITADDDRVLFNNGVFSSGRSERDFLGARGLPGFETTAELGANHPPGASIDFKHSDAFDVWGDDKFAALTGDTNVFGDNSFGDGGLFITNNVKAGTIVWTEVNNAGEPDSSQFADLQVALNGMVPTFYVTVGSGTGFTADQLWKVTGVGADGSGAATAAWTRIDTNIPGASGVSIFAADPVDPARLYAVAIVGGEPRIFRSTTGGSNWDADIELDGRMVDPDDTGPDDFKYRTLRGPADFPFNAGAPQPNQGLTGYPQPTLLAFDPEDPTIIVAGGADSGVFLSTNGGEDWELLTDPLGTNPNVPHIPRPRGAHFDHEGGVTTLFLASQGSGIWRIKLDIPTQPVIAPDSFETPTPNDVKANATVLSGGEPSFTDKTIHNGTDVDYYEYTADQTGNAIVNLYFNNLFGNLDLIIKNSSDSVIQTGEQGNVTDNVDLERVIFPVVAGEKYYIVVQGVSGATGFYDIVVQKSVPEVTLFIEAGIGTGSTLTGRLGFLQLDVTAIDTDFDADGGAGDGLPDPTNIRAEFTIDIFNGDNPADNRLSLFELGSVDAVVAITAEAKVNFDLKLGLNDELLPDTISAALPTVRAKFLLDWAVGAPITGDFNLADSLKLIEFRDIGLDLGSFLADTVGPIVAKIQEITEPLQPIVDIITARIPVLSDLAGRTITLADIAAAFGEFDPAMIYAIADIISLVNSLETGGGELFIELGDFKIVDKEHPENALGGANGGFLLNPNLDFGSGGGGGADAGIPDLGISNFKDKLTEIGNTFGDLTDSAVLDGIIGGGGPDSGTEATAKSLFSGGFSSTPDSSGFAFPIFEDPSQVFGLLLGRNATLITYDLPPFLMEFKWEVSFPIYGPLWGVVAAGVGLKIDLAFGYDTQGIKDFAAGGFENPLDLLSGFYVSDTNMPDGSFGVDVPELTFSGSIGVGAELNAGIASAGVTANIILTVDFDLYDPNHDGKVRISELVSTFLFEVRNGNPLLAPISIFDVAGNVAFQLSAYIKFLFARFDFDITPPIVLFEFSIPFDREPILATERGDGSVLLNMGPNAAARQNGDVRDISEKFYVKDGGSGKVAVWAPDFGVPESAAQLYSIGGDNPIVAGFGGEGDDTIDVSGLTTNSAELEGGSGNDMLTGGENADIIKGDVGDDVLKGKGDDDIVYGGDGNDDIDGGEDDDILFGDTGSVTATAIRTSQREKDGNDTITGGLGLDIVFGGGGDDSIGGDVAFGTLDGGGAADNDFLFGDAGGIALPNGTTNKVTNADGTVSFPDITLTDRPGGGKDKIRGHGGLDVIFGGAGDDDIDGGTENDTIFGESGFDLISGGAHADLIMGGTEDDRIFGFRDELYAGDLSDGNDTIFGQNGNDFIRGNQGNDLIHGNAGADVIFGDYGNDTITGDTEPDLIFGGPDRDTVDAGTGNDIVFGDDGFVVWVNFFDPDIDDMTDTPDDHRATGLIGGKADVFDNTFNPALTDATLDGLDPDIRADADEKEKTLDLIKTLVNGATDGNDTITGGEGDDIVLGGADALFSGVKGDTIYGDFNPGIAPGTPPAGPIPAGEDILIGDGGRIQFDIRRRDNVRTIPGTGPAEVGNDTISGNGGKDLIFGGGANDTLYGRMSSAFTNSLLDEDFDRSENPPVFKPISDDDVIIGDDGEIQYETLGLPEPEPFEPNPGEEIEIGEARQSLAGARAVFVFIRTEQLNANALATGGMDHAYGNKGEDIIFGGVAGDFLKGDDGADGDDIILGDNGQIDFGLDDDGITTQIEQIYTTDTLETTGGPDTIEGQDDNDIIFGGVNNGGPDVLYGDRATPINGSDAQDIILGDNGKIRFDVDPDLDTLDKIESYLDGLGGADTISGNRGNDVLIGSTGGDTMYGDDANATDGSNDGEDIMLGDNGNVVLIGLVGRLIVRGTAVDLITTTDVVETTGGADTMSGNAKADIMLGGVNNGGIDKMYGDRFAPNATTIPNDGDDVMLGDNGLLDFTFAPDTDRNTLDLISSAEDNRGGADEISGDKGLDVAIGGTNGDTIYGDDANHSANASDLADILLGDNADIFLVAKGLASGGDLKLVLGAAVKTVKTTDEENPSYGGSDTISGNAKGDIIAGGVKGDTLYGDRQNPDGASTTNEGNDIILGDNAALEWLSNGRFSEITGINIDANNHELWVKYGLAVADTDLTTLDLITTEQPNSGGRDFIFGDEGKDLILGGTDSDTIYGDDGLPANLPEGLGTASNNDLIFGDHGRIYPQFSKPNLSGVQSRNFFAIDIGDTSGGEGDRMWGEEGNDVMLGQQGDDRMWGGGADDDMIGGHNVSGGYDELTAPAIGATLDLAPAVNDLMDGGSGFDTMAGDNAIVWRRNDETSPRFRKLNDTGAVGAADDRIYSTTNSTITTNVGPINQSDPNDAVGRDIELVDHSFAVQANPQGRFGADVMAGGTDSDVMFGELGNDLMQGDGFIGANDGDVLTITRTIAFTDSGINPDTDQTYYFNIPEDNNAAGGIDGDDYMEGNGGNDLMFGNLGQDDIIGGSSALFGLTSLLLRPDGSDTIFGGAGIDLARNNIGEATLDGPTQVITTTPTGHARDADFIMGDNANVFRIVKGAVNPVSPTALEDVFLTFNYDNYTNALPLAQQLKIVPRGMQHVDYTIGGADFQNTDPSDAAPWNYVNGAAGKTDNSYRDNGAFDLIHGESGDDYIFGQTGSDIIYGEGQDDDIVGGYGNDWISGGTGQDGVLGDDGLLLISRNSTAGEPLYGVKALLLNSQDPHPKYSDGTVLDEAISTPGQIQTAVINVTGELKVAADLVPFSYDAGWMANDDEYPDNEDPSPFADDIIFGGLGSDFLHGGSGDDAMLGAEALPVAYVPVYNVAGDPINLLNLGYNVFNVADPINSPINPGDLLALNTNPGNVLAFNNEDVDGQHTNNRFRAGEFRLYDEYSPRHKILLNPNGSLWDGMSATFGAASQFVLNFEKAEGVVRPEGDVPKATGQQTEHYPQVNDDGADAIFGDLGNDWIVGGTGRDDMFGGWGNDLLQADDNHETETVGPNKDGIDFKFDNESTDTQPFYQDRAYGGAGRDVIILNTGGDRGIDWVGEYNSYLVPYAPFGEASVSRTMQPYLPEFLYALSFGDGADPTRFADAVGGTPPAPTNNDPNPSRNGEPHGELGLVLQKDFAWGDQTGAPADPQAGNIPGGPRDVLRGADFNGGNAQGFMADSGSWTVTGNRYQVAPAVAGGDAVSVFYVDNYIPKYFEMLATINAVKPTGGSNSNVYVIFDYQSSTDFKFAGINVSTNKLELGHRDAQGWVVDKQVPYQSSLKAGTDYNAFLSVNGTAVIFTVNNQVTMNFTFAPRVDIFGISHGINEGMVGLGARNGKAEIDNVVVQRIPPAITLNQTLNFSAASSLLQTPLSGTWNLSGGRYAGTASGSTPAIDLFGINIGANSLLDFSSAFKTSGEGGFIFDQYAADDFKFVTISVITKQVILGHRTSKGWFIDATYSNSSLNATTDYTLGLTLKGTTASVTLNGATVLSRIYNGVVTDGGFGLLESDWPDIVRFSHGEERRSELELKPEAIELIELGLLN